MVRNFFAAFPFQCDDVDKKIKILSGGKNPGCACHAAGPAAKLSLDRYFLHSLVNRAFEIDHGQMRIFEGNYDYYLEQIAPAGSSRYVMMGKQPRATGST